MFDFKLGDRVIAVNHSSGFAEYGVGPAHTTGHIPEGISFEGKRSIGESNSDANRLQRRQPRV